MKESLHKLEIQSREQIQKVAESAKTKQILIRWGALVFIAFLVYQSITEI